MALQLEHVLWHKPVQIWLTTHSPQLQVWDVKDVGLKCGSTKLALIKNNNTYVMEKCSLTIAILFL